MKKIELYNYFRSSASFRVRIALHLKQLEYTYKPVHLLKDGGEQHKAAYTELNPMHEVPTLIHNGKSISQSMAIIEYLDEVFPEPQLFPNDSYKKSQVRMLCECVNSGIHPVQNLKVLQMLETVFKADQQQKEAWGAHWIHSGFVGIEKILTQTSEQYCFGNVLTAADLFVVPQVFNAQRFKLDLTPFPMIRKIFENCMILPAFDLAQPSKQIDAQ